MPEGNGSTGHKPDKPNWWQRAVRSGTGQAIRWLAILGLVLWRWAAGLPKDFTGWLPVIIIAVVLLLPDADSIAFGEVKLELRRTREDVAALRQQMTNLQIAQARAAAIGAFSLTTDNPAVVQEFAAAVGLVTQTAAAEATPLEPYSPEAT